MNLSVSHPALDAGSLVHVKIGDAGAEPGMTAFIDEEILEKNKRHVNKKIQMR